MITHEHGHLIAQMLEEALHVPPMGEPRNGAEEIANARAAMKAEAMQ